MFRNNLRKESLIVIPREEINIANNIADIAGLPTLKKKGLRDCQFEAITELDKSFISSISIILKQKLLSRINVWRFRAKRHFDANNMINVTNTIYVFRKYSLYLHKNLNDITNSITYEQKTDFYWTILPADALFYSGTGQTLLR